MQRVLVLEANQAVRQALLVELHRRGVEAEGLGHSAEAGLALDSGRVQIVVLGPTGGTVADLVGMISSLGPDEPRPGGQEPVEIVALVDGANNDAVGLQAIRDGASDFVPLAAGAETLTLAMGKIAARGAFQTRAVRGARGAASVVGRQVSQVDWDPHGRTEAVDSVGAAVSAAGEPLRDLRPEAKGPALLGASPKIVAVLTLIRRLAGVKTGVLVGGESGTGKELVAQALHDQAPWRDGPFVAVNCGAIAAGLIESELFGHVRGSFTDAVRDRLGLFQAAHGGTLFLDEIADLPLALQPKLLRALQEGVIHRVGDSGDISIDVRVVAATARHLPAEVAAGRFREDLYYRLAGLTIHLPPLRERPEDVPLLAHHFLARARQRLGVKVYGIDPEALSILATYSWPGNVRELENSVERAAVLCAADRIDVASLPERMLRGSGPQLGGGHRNIDADADADADPAGLSIKRAARRSEEDLIKRALARTSGNRTRAAELLEISHRALLYKIKEYGITIASGREISGATASPGSQPAKKTS